MVYGIYPTRSSCGGKINSIASYYYYYYYYAASDVSFSTPCILCGATGQDPACDAGLVGGVMLTYNCSCGSRHQLIIRTCMSHGGTGGVSQNISNIMVGRPSATGHYATCGTCKR